MAEHPRRHAGAPAHRRPPVPGARRALSLPRRAARLARELRAAGLGRLVAGALALLIGGLLVFGTVAAQVAGRAPVVRADADLTRWLRDHAQEPSTTLATIVTQLGGAVVLCAVTAVAMTFALRRGRRADAALVAAALVGSQVLTLILKAAFDRPRPVLPDPLAGASWLSFPSGHASGATAVYGTLALLAARRVPSLTGRVLLVTGWAVLVALIAFTRVYLGVHYLTDVIAGIGIGSVCLGAVLLAHLALEVRPRPRRARLSRGAGRSRAPGRRRSRRSG